jgi:hypothetical protein
MNNAEELYEFLISKIKNDVNNPIELNNFMASMLLIMRVTCEYFLHLELLSEEGKGKIKKLHESVLNFQISTSETRH